MTDSDDTPDTDASTADPVPAGERRSRDRRQLIDLTRAEKGLPERRSFRERRREEPEPEPTEGEGRVSGG